MELPDGVTDHGPLLRVDLAAGEPLYLRRGTLIASSERMDVRTRKDFKGVKGGLKSVMGGTLVVNAWTCSVPATVTAALGFYGRSLGIRVAPGLSILSSPKLYLGHRGDVQRRIRKGAKKEFWFVSEVSGDGTLYLHVPSGYTVVPLTGSDTVLDYERIAALVGEFEITGEALDLKSWMKSGETNSLLVTGEGYAVLSHSSLESIEGESGGGGFVGSIVEIFT